jgi:hypothetical protein
VEEEARVEVKAHVEQEALEEEDKDDGDEEESAPQGVGAQRQVKYRLVEF